MTRGWRRLQELPGLGLPIIEYPLPEVRARMREDGYPAGRQDELQRAEDVDVGLRQIATDGDRG